MDVRSPVTGSEVGTRCLLEPMEGRHGCSGQAIAWAWASITCDSACSYPIKIETSAKTLTLTASLRGLLRNPSEFVSQPLTKEQFVFDSYIANSKLHDDNILTAESCGLHEINRWLENNNLVGIVPQRLVKKPGLSFKFSGNPHLCMTLGCDSPSHLRQPHANVALLAIGIRCSVSIMILIISALVAFIFHRQSASNPPVSSRGSTKMCLIEVGAYVIDSPSEEIASTCAEFLQEHQLSSVAENSIRRFSVADLRVMTKKFSRKVCEGGYGTVFHGRAKDGQEIAVEILARDPCKDAHEFSLEATMLSRLHHQNVVPVIGYCNDSREHIVVYEYMQNGPLCDHIHVQSSKAERMDWLTRLNIAIDAAKGLEYLHKECKPSIIHGDVKSSNILLGETMRAKVLINTLLRVAAPRTTDYLDPEYYRSQQLTAKSDVYSFGVVLLELISGHRLPSRKRQDSLIIWARELLQVGDLKAIVDPALQQGFCLEVVWKFAELAMCCVEPLRYHRPDMSNVVKELRRIIQVEESGKPLHLDC